RRVRAKIRVELRAHPRERLVHFDCRSSAAPFIEHVDGQRREAIFPWRIAGRAALDQQEAGDDRQGGVADGPDVQPISQRRLFDRGKVEWLAVGRLRHARAIDLDGRAAHDTTACEESWTASSGRPRGTTLSVTRGEAAT